MNNERKKMFDVIITGAGIAGLTAAIYARRANKKVLVLEGKTYGGQIISTLEIRNWPAEPGISGVELMQRIYHQVNNLGVEVAEEEVLKLQDLGGIKVVKTDEGEYQARTVIIATGSVDRPLGLLGEEKMVGRGISYCATCDGAFYKGKTVAVVGGGNTAFYDALYLTGVAEKVYLIHRRNEFRADAVLVEKLKGKENIEFVLENHPVNILGEKKVEGIVVENSAGEQREIPVSGIFVAVGREPATEFCRGTVELDENGYVVAGEDCRTSCAGIFVAGDCRTKTVRQLVTAAGDGAVAATEAVRMLK